MRFGNELVRRVQSVDRRVYDALLAVAALMLIVASMIRPGTAAEVYDFRELDVFIVGSGVVAALALLFRRHQPFAVHLVVLACAAIPALLDY